MLVDVSIHKVYAALFLGLQLEGLLLANLLEHRKIFLIVNFPYSTEECVISLGGSFIEFDIHS